MYCLWFVELCRARFIDLKEYRRSVVVLGDRWNTFVTALLIDLYFLSLTLLCRFRWTWKLFLREQSFIRGKMLGKNLLLVTTSWISRGNKVFHFSSEWRISGPIIVFVILQLLFAPAHCQFQQFQTISCPMRPCMAPKARVVGFAASLRISIQWLAAFAQFKSHCLFVFNLHSVSMDSAQYLESFPELLTSSLQSSAHRDFSLRKAVWHFFELSRKYNILLYASDISDVCWVLKPLKALKLRLALLLRVNL